MRKLFSSWLGSVLVLVFLCLVAISPAWAQKYSYQPPVQTFGQFSASRPMASYTCSPTQKALGTPMLEFIDTTGALRGLVDCSGAIVGSATTTFLTAAALHEFNAVNTVTAMQKSGNNAILVGTFPNCAVANTLVGEWGTIAGFVNGANNGFGGPVTACTATTLTFVNPAVVAEVHAATFTNRGFQLMKTVQLGGFSASVVPTRISIWNAPVSAYTLGNNDNVFSFAYAGQSPNWSTTETIPANGFLTLTAPKGWNIGGFLNDSPYDVFVNVPILIELTGTTPALTGGDGGVLQVNTEYTQMMTVLTD